MAEAIDHSLRHMTVEDVRAIAVYLKTVPALRDGTDTKPAFAWGNASDDLAAIRGVPVPEDRDQWSGARLYGAYCASCHQAQGQGSFDGGLPPLFHNTALGRTNTNNLVMAILVGVRREPDVNMPGFTGELSDRQIATLGSYLIRHFGNPGARVTADQVAALRAGGAGGAWLVPAMRVAMALAVLLAIAVAVALVSWRRRAASA
jgi:mono/diheme cytochrome c family protein